MDKYYDSIIVGTAIAGCAAAITLARQGREVHLLERSLKEPDRIAGEVLQPAGVIALQELGLGSALEDIDAIPFQGYYSYWKGEEATLLYPRVQLCEGKEGIRLEGPCFHHGRFVSKLRDLARRKENITYVQVRKQLQPSLSQAGGQEEWLE